MTTWGQGRNTRLYNQAKRALPRYCQHCGTTNQLELDHIVPLAEYGDDTLANSQWLCHNCHTTKTRQESRRGIQRRTRQRHRKPEQHPGLIR